MTKKSVSPIRRVFLISFVTLVVGATAVGEVKTTPDWHTQNLPFRVINTTGIGLSLWVCGTDEAVAVSSDAGEHWQVKHQATGGMVLLNIGFANEKFGYAAGTGGLYLTTEDGGETWHPHSAGKDAILQVSFSDPNHGLIRTFSSLLFTTDGGANWGVVSAGQNAEDIKRLPYTFSLVALDSIHMAVMMKRGPAQAYEQGFLVTQDSGKSWRFLVPPNVTLYSFLSARGKYWAVGTEVIHKDQPGGGYGVPVALYSSDGEKWDHSNNDQSGCKSHMCVACGVEGCLSANGMITDVFSDKTVYRKFSPNPELTSKWASAGSAICFVGKGLQCGDLKAVVEPGSGEGPLPTVVGPGPLGATAAQGPQCVVCGFDRIFIDKEAQGPYTIKLSVEIAKNGTVTNVSAEGAPTPGLKARIEQQGQEWIFEPYLKDGVAVNAKMNTSLRINVIKPR